MVDITIVVVASILIVGMAVITVHGNCGIFVAVTPVLIVVIVTVVRLALLLLLVLLLLFFVLLLLRPLPLWCYSFWLSYFSYCCSIAAVLALRFVSVFFAILVVFIDVVNLVSSIIVGL